MCTGALLPAVCASANTGTEPGGGIDSAAEVTVKPLGAKMTEPCVSSSVMVVVLTSTASAFTVAAPAR